MQKELSVLYQYKIIMVIENHFGITINDEEFEDIITLENLSDNIIKKLQDKGVTDLVNTLP
jgi:hypothetical protein